MERLPVSVSHQGDQHHIVGEARDFELTSTVAETGPVELTNTVVHPAGPTLAVAVADKVDNSMSLASFVAFVVADVFGDLARERPNAARAVAVVTSAAVGIYQLTPLKYRYPSWHRASTPAPSCRCG